MANVANYTVIEESPPTLPKDSGDIDHDIEGDGVERTLHEVVPANLLQARGNTLTLRVKGAGEVAMSNVLLLFKTTV